MPTIYSGIEGIALPKMVWSNFDGYQKDCEIYLSKLKTYAKKHNVGVNVGEIVQFPVADGSADYMLLKRKPLQIVHIGTMDAYETNLAKTLSLKTIDMMVDQRKRVNKLFSKEK